jgi:molybdate transport system regulatory protein
MLTSARNEFCGKITAIHEGTVNDEIDIKLKGGEELVAIITRTSAKSLKLREGHDVVALVKASWVILASPESGLRLSSRNRLEGTVKSIKVGAVNTEVDITLKGGESLVAIVTESSHEELGLAEGKPVVAYIKASHVIIGVKD